MCSKLLEALELFDNDSRGKRVERIQWLSLHEVTAPIMMGRPETLLLIREAREVFVNGHYAATLLVAMAAIEHTVIEELQLLGHVARGLKERTPRFPSALAIARTQKVFPPDWLARAERLVSRRNPFAHLRHPEDPDTLGKRIWEEKRHPTSILEEDAKDAIDLMFNLFQATLREVDGDALMAAYGRQDDGMA